MERLLVAAQGGGEDAGHCGSGVTTYYFGELGPGVWVEGGVASEEVLFVGFG